MKEYMGNKMKEYMGTTTSVMFTRFRDIRTKLWTSNREEEKKDLIFSIQLFYLLGSLGWIEYCQGSLGRVGSIVSAMVGLGL